MLTCLPRHRVQPTDPAQRHAEPPRRHAAPTKGGCLPCLRCAVQGRRPARGQPAGHTAAQPQQAAAQPRHSRGRERGAAPACSRPHGCTAPRRTPRRPGPARPPRQQILNTVALCAHSAAQRVGTWCGRRAYHAAGCGRRAGVGGIGMFRDTTPFPYPYRFINPTHNTMRASNRLRSAAESTPASKCLTYRLCSRTAGAAPSAAQLAPPAAASAACAALQSPVGGAARPGQPSAEPASACCLLPDAIQPRFASAKLSSREVFCGLSTLQGRDSYAVHVQAYEFARPRCMWGGSAAAASVWQASHA